MTFLTAQQLTNLTSATIAFWDRGAVTHHTRYEKHLLADLMASTGDFPGNPGKRIIWQTQFAYNRTEQGYEGDQKVTFDNPANLKQAESKAYNRHVGLVVSHDEVRENGVEMRDTIQGWDGRKHAKAAAVQLVDLLTNKVEDMKEGQARDRSKMFWGDGSDSRLSIPGVQFWVQDDPTVAMVVGGIDQGAVPAWRNRAALGIVANLGNASSTVLIDKLQSEWRQLTRYGGAPTKAYCGSDFIEQLERELRSRGSFTEAGWSGKSLDISMNDINFKGMRFVYEPELDELGLAKRMYWLNIGPSGFRVMYMGGHKNVKHEPPREADRYVTRISETSTLGTMMKRRNNSGVYSIA